MGSTFLKAICLAALMTLCQGQGQDATLTPGSFGAQIVDVVISRIRSRCIFSEDRLFLRRTAYVMSRDGRNSDTYKIGFDGGIWQVSEAMFLATQACTNPQLAAACNIISSSFSIHWPSVQWSDLRKPLYSGIAAALSSLLALGGTQMPGNITDQATYWAQMYGFPEQTFRDEAPNTPLFQCKDKLDLAFILDASGSVSYLDFQLMLAAAADVVDVMNVSQDGVRIADIVFSSSASVSFDFDDHSSKADVKSGLLNTPKVNGGTNTAAALDLARTTLYSPSRGARSDVKKVAVLVTDGQSNSFTSTSSYAKLLRDAGTTVFAVGVGNYRLSELQAVASDPICTHVLTLTSFDQITSILTEIQKSTCEANYKFTETKPITGQLTAQPSEHTAETKVPGTKKTIEAVVSCGILNIYVSSTDPKPGPAVFDNRYMATPDVPAVLRVVETLPQGAPVYVCVVGARLPATAAALRNCSDYNWTMSVTPQKDIKVTCQENGVTRPCTKSDIGNTGLCPDDNALNLPVENPCTLQNLQNGLLRHSYPYDPTKFLQCDMKGRYYITPCPGGVIFNALSRECGFASPGVAPPPSTGAQPGNGVGPGNGQTYSTNFIVAPPTLASTCSPQMLAQNKYYHSYSPDKSKFIQCNEWGVAFIMPCASGTEWSQADQTCVHIPTPAPTPACVAGQLLPDPCNHHKFYQCGHAGTTFSMSCPWVLYFDPVKKVCDWTDTNPAPIPASCASG